MKKACKIIFITIIALILNTFLGNSNVYSYTKDEVKEIINYQEVSGTLSEDKYDIKIEAEDLVDDEKVPVIQKTIESVLYGNDNMTDINFLTTNSTNTGTTWNYIQENVEKYYRIALYVSIAAMLTVLIYMGICIVLGGINNGNVNSEKKRKDSFEQWVIAIVLIACVTVIINLIVNFTEIITEAMTEYNVEESKFTVYVHDSSSSSKSYTFETNIEGLIMFQSQYDWSKYLGRNLVNILGGALINLFKMFVYFVFELRTLVCAFLVIVAPIVIVINAYNKIKMQKGIFMSWLIIFFFCAMIKPVIALLYYVLTATDLLLKFPLYIALVAVLEVVALIVLTWIFIQVMKMADKSEQREVDEMSGKRPATPGGRAYRRDNENKVSNEYESIVKELKIMYESGLDADKMAEKLDGYYNTHEKDCNNDKNIFVKKLDELGGLKQVDTESNEIIKKLINNQNGWQSQFEYHYES